MPATIDVLVPAPVLHVPARSRHTRLSFAAVTERVTLRDLSCADAPEWGVVEVNTAREVRIRVVDGKPFQPVDMASVAPGARADAFRDWLEGREEWRGLDEEGMQRSLGGTPLLARVPGKRSVPRPYGLWKAGREGRILLDDREAAGARARAFLDGDVALIGGVPHRRMVGPLAYVSTRLPDGAANREKGPIDLRLVGVPGAWTTNLQVSNGNLYDVRDAVRDAAAFLGVAKGRIRTGWDASLASDFPPMPGDALATNFREMIRAIHAVPPIGGYGIAAAHVDWLERTSAVGTVGGALQDPAEAWGDLRLFCDAFVEGGNASWSMWVARRMVGYHDTVAARALAVAPAAMPEPDAEGLSALAP